MAAFLLKFALAIGASVAMAGCGRPEVTLRVVSLQNTSGSVFVRCELQNRGLVTIDLSMHTLDRTPCYHRLCWEGGAWRRPVWDMEECGIDLAPATLAPGQAMAFSASIAKTSTPTRLAVNYRRDGKGCTVSSTVFTP